ncbi:MAG: translocation/assembly module TamB domain-containing protein [Candidatus Magnetoovum sp. WYHC-5]|nr:translocation/assembly module TamB domain-containing protein [Candidatus Magnetoovum sp. WYHC-5]
MKIKVNIKIKKSCKIFFLVLIIAFILIKNFYLNDFLLNKIKQELQTLFGQNVKLARVYVSIIPLKVTLYNLEIRDKHNKKLAGFDSLDVHVELFSLLMKHIVIEGLTVQKPFVYTEKKQLEALMGRKHGSSTLSFDIKEVFVTDGAFTFVDGKNSYSVAMKEFKGHWVRDFTDLVLSFEGIIIGYDGEKHIIKDNKLNVQVLTVSVLKDEQTGKYILRDLIYRSDGLKVDVSGELNKKDLSGSFKPLVELKMDYLKEMFSLKGPGGGNITIDGDIAIHGKDVRPELSIKGDFYIETLLELLDVDEPISGYVNLAAKTYGAINALQAKGAVTLTNGSLYDVAVDKLNAGVAFEERQLKFLDVKARLYNGASNASAYITLYGGKHLELYVDVYDVDSAGVFKVIEWDPNISPGKITGSLISKGEKFNPNIIFIYKKNKTLPVNTEKEDFLKRINIATGKVYLKKKVLTADTLTIKSELSEITTNGTIDLNQKTIDVSAKLKTDDTGDFTMPYTDEFKSKGVFDITVKGALKRPVINGKVVLEKGVLFNVDFSRLSGDVFYDVDAFSFKKGQAILYSGQLAIEAGLTFRDAQKLLHFNKPTLNLSVDVKGVSVKELLSGALNIKQDISGFIYSQTFKVTGGLDSLEYGGHVAIKNFKAYGIDLAEIESDVKLSGKLLELPLVKTKNGSSTLSFELAAENRGKSWAEKNNIFYNINSKDCKIALKDTPLKVHVSGSDMACAFAGKGNLLKPELSFDAKAQGLSAQGVDIGAASVKGTVDSQGVKITGNFLNGNVLADAGLAFSKKIPWHADVKISKGEYGFLINKFIKNAKKNTKMDTKLKLAGSVALSGDVGSFKGKFSLTGLDISAYGHQLSNSGEIRFNILNRDVSIESFALKEGPNKLTASGGLSIAKSFDLHMEGGISLKTLKFLSDKITLINGDGRVLLKIDGSWDKPDVYGDMEITNGSLGLRNFDHFFNTINGYAFFDSDKIVLARLNGLIGGGNFAAKGTTYLNGLNVKRFFFESKVKGVPFKMENGLKLQVGGDINYKGDSVMQVLTGSVDIESASYNKDFYIMDVVLGKKSQARDKDLGFFEKTILNVTLKGDKNITIKNNIARSNLKIDLTVRGTVLTPMLYGRVETDSGKVFVNDNEFDITEASALFTGNIDHIPYVNVLAKTKKKGYTINLLVDGRIDALNLAMSSNPPLKDEEILSMLSTGSGTSGATSFIAGKYERMISDRIKDLTGLDEVNVSAASSESEGRTATAISPKVTLKKELIPDKLILTLITTGTSSEDLIKVEYLINKNFSVQGVGDKTKGVGGDFKLRFEFN